MFGLHMEGNVLQEIKYVIFRRKFQMFHFMQNCKPHIEGSLKFNVSWSEIHFLDQVSAEYQSTETRRHRS